MKILLTFIYIEFSSVTRNVVVGSHALRHVVGKTRFKEKTFFGKSSTVQLEKRAKSQIYFFQLL